MCRKCTFDKIQHLFTIKHLSKQGIEEDFNLVKNIYKKMTIDNIIFNGKKLQAFPLQSGVSLSSWFCIIALEILGNMITQDT